MNILIVSQYYYPEQFSINQISANLVKMGHHVTVLTGVPNYPMGKLMEGYENRSMTETIHGVRVIRVPMCLRGHGVKMILNYLSYAWNAARKVKKLIDKYDVVYVYEVSPVTQIYPAYVYKKRINNNAKIVVNCQDIWPEVLKTYGFTEKSLIYRTGNILSGYLYKKADTIAVSSPLFQDYLAEQFDIKKNKMKLLMNYADEWVLNVTKTPHEKTHFLFAGNMGKTQNLELIIEAVGKCNRQKEMIIDFVGDGSELNNLKEQVKRMNLTDVVKFHGRKNQKELKEYYDLADAYLLTLNCENKVCYTIPSKVQGYMGAGKPIIASILGGSKDLIEKVNCGILCDYNDSSALARVMDDFVKDNSKSKMLGDNGRNFFIKNFREDKYMNNLVNILEDGKNE